MLHATALQWYTSACMRTGSWVIYGGSVCAETRVALIQRSCGYALRPTLDIAEIDMAVQVIKSQQPDCIVAVDNCYGEFTATKEPCAVSFSCPSDNS